MSVNISYLLRHFTGLVIFGTLYELKSQDDKIRIFKSGEFATLRII